MGGFCVAGCGLQVSGSGSTQHTHRDTLLPPNHPPLTLPSLLTRNPHEHRATHWTGRGAEG